MWDHEIKQPWEHRTQENGASGTLGLGNIWLWESLTLKTQSLEKIGSWEFGPLGTQDLIGPWKFKLLGIWNHWTIGSWEHIHFET